MNSSEVGVVGLEAAARRKATARYGERVRARWGQRARAHSEFEYPSLPAHRSTRRGWPWGTANVRVYRRLAAALVVLVAATVRSAPALLPDPPSISAKSYILMDGSYANDTGRAR